jgi:hypothetical protein
MTKPYTILSENQMESLRRVAESAMTTPVTIMRRVGETGLEITDDPYGSSVSFSNVTPAGGCLGWLHSVPTPVATVESGAIVTVNTYRLFLPHDIDVRPGDHVTIASDTYVVSDTTANETWPALLQCSLRLRE